MKNTSCTLTEYTFSGAVPLASTARPLRLETSACHLFTGQATESSSDCGAYLNGGKVREFVCLTGCRNSFFLKSAYSQLSISALHL